MQNEDLTPVNLWLAGRSYRILVKKGEAEKIRLSVKLADEKIAELKSTYAGKDTQDFLAMCLLMYASDSNGNDSITIADDLKKITEKIDKALE
jgi:cell division protein ZapA